MRVVIADDLMLMRAGIARLLADAGIEIVGEASGADQLLRQVAGSQPDVAIVDIRMPPTQTDEGLVAAGENGAHVSGPSWRDHCRSSNRSRHVERGRA